MRKAASSFIESTKAVDKSVSVRANAAGWKAFQKSLDALSESPRAMAAYKALSASEFDPAPTAEPPESIVASLSDADLDAVKQVFEKSVGFLRAADQLTPFTSLRFRQQKAAEAAAVLSAEKMHRVISSTVADDHAPAPSSPGRRRRQGAI